MLVVALLALAHKSPGLLHMQDLFAKLFQNGTQYGP